MDPFLTIVLFYVAGFLIGALREDEYFGRHVWVGHGAHAAREPEVARDLYAGIAGEWVAQGAGLHLDELTVNPDADQQQRQPQPEDEPDEHRQRRPEEGRLGTEPVRLESLL